MNTPMTSEQITLELQRQSIADQRERIGSDEHDDPSIDKYRLVNRIVKQAPIPALSADFAARVAQQVGDYEERAQFESSALTVMVVVAIIAGLFFALPPLINASQNFTVSIDLPWPMLFAVLCALGFAALIDRLSSQYRLSQT